MRRRRTQAERDAATVEIGYALVTAVFLAAVAFGVVAGPALAWRLPDSVSVALYLAGASLAAVLAVVRVVHVLRRHTRRARP